MLIGGSLLSAGMGLLQGNSPVNVAKNLVSKIPVVGGLLGGLFGGPPQPPGGIWLANNSAAMNLVATKDFRY